MIIDEAKLFTKIKTKEENSYSPSPTRSTAQTDGISDIAFPTDHDWRVKNINAKFKPKGGVYYLFQNDKIIKNSYVHIVFVKGKLFFKIKKKKNKIKEGSLKISSLEYKRTPEITIRNNNIFSEFPIQQKYLSDKITQDQKEFQKKF